MKAGKVLRVLFILASLSIATYLLRIAAKGVRIYRESAVVESLRSTYGEHVSTDDSFSSWGLLRPQSLTLRNPDTPIALIGDCQNIFRVGINGRTVKEVDLEVLSHLESLIIVTIEDCSIDPADMGVLKDLPNLRQLEIVECHGSGVDLDGLESIPELKYLKVTKTKISSRGLSNISKSKHIVDLDLSGSELDRVQLAEALKSLPELKVLKIQNLNLSDQDAKSIAAISPVIEADNNRLISNEGAAAFFGPDTDSISLRGTSVSDGLAAEVYKSVIAAGGQTNRNYWTIDLRDTRISVSGVSEMSDLPFTRIEVTLSPLLRDDWQ